MQYSWAVAAVLSAMAGIYFSIRRRFAPRKFIFWLVTSFLGPIVVFASDIYWEWFLNADASRGWTILITFPAFAASIIFSLISAAALGIWKLRFSRDSTDGVD